MGHGSARNADSSAPTRRLAAEIAARGLFGEVLAVFHKEAPFMADAFDLVSAHEVFVVPNFAGEGYYTREMIPARMGLTGRLTRREDGRRILYTDPVGTHPRIAALLRRRADDVVAAHGLDPAETCLLLVGHGSSRPGGSGGTAEALAARIRADGRYGQVATAFLEQAPFVADWPALVNRRDVIGVPLLIAQGLHGSEDLPPLFGLTAGETGPADIHGHRVWYCRGIGHDPEILDIVLDQVAACEALAGAA